MEWSHLGTIKRIGLYLALRASSNLEMHCIADSELGTSMACSQSRGRREKEREGEGGWTDGHCGGAQCTLQILHTKWEETFLIF